MKILKIIVVLFLLFQNVSFLSAQKITENAEISLITCSPGTEELYAHFGHSAFRVKDSTTNTDIIFNYGVFDFDTPNFYWKFIKGKLQYKLAIQPSYYFFQMYSREGREVKDEELILTEEEKSDVIEFLEWNYEPENRYYTYDFFYDNCSSKLWDVVKTQLNTDYIFDLGDYEEKTFRQMLHEYLGNARWAEFGIDIALGLPADKTANFEEQMFLPDYLSDNMKNVKRETTVAGSKSILGPEKIIIEEKDNKKAISVVGQFFNNPVMIAWVFLGLVILLTILCTHSSRRLFDLVFFSLTGLLGLFLLFLWTGTDHTAMNANLDMLWASPLSAFYAFFLLKNRTTLLKIFTIMITVSVLILLLGWSALPQQFHLAVLPLALLVLFRMFDNLRYQFFIHQDME
ncbi:MAG: DUF4105 domain-containing protein [Bacteroidales bacterium]